MWPVGGVKDNETLLHNSWKACSIGLFGVICLLKLWKNSKLKTGISFRVGDFNAFSVSHYRYMHDPNLAIKSFV